MSNGDHTNLTCSALLHISNKPQVSGGQIFYGYCKLITRSGAQRFSFFLFYFTTSAIKTNIYEKNGVKPTDKNTWLE